MPKKKTQPLAPPEQTLYFHHAGLTHTGILRNHNEDAYKLPNNIDADTLNQQGYFYVLADGMGGHQKGEVASAVTIETTNAAYYSARLSLDGDDPKETLVEAMAGIIEQANEEVLTATEGGGTTIVAAVLYRDLLVVMNIGDSRAYLLRNGELHLVSRDHSLVSRLREMGRITAEEALNHPRQNVLYQALGQGSDLEIHVFSEQMQAGDRLILCSDGLWGPVGDAGIKQVLNQIASPGEAAHKLIEMANAAGGPDNITVIIVNVSNDAAGFSESVTADQFMPKTDDAQPFETAPRQIPTTLPEGKYFVKN